MASGSVHIPWYATGLRADRLAGALAEIAPVALRYGASSYSVYRYQDDRYKFLQTATFAEKRDWERYWGGPEMQRFRVMHNGFYQVPVVYGWTEVVAQGSLPDAPVAGGDPSSLGDNGEPADVF